MEGGVRVFLDKITVLNKEMQERKKENILKMSSMAPRKLIILMNSSFWEIYQQYCCSYQYTGIFLTYIYQSWIFVVSLFPSTLLPVHVWSQSWRSTVAFVSSLSFLSGETRVPRLPLCSFFSISPTWSLGPSFPRAAQVSFGSITTSCPRGSWDACHVCPHIPVCPPLQDGQDETGCQIKKSRWQNAFSSWQFYLSFSVSIQVRK